MPSSQRSLIVAALLGGLVSAALLAAVLLATGSLGDDSGDEAGGGGRAAAGPPPATARSGARGPRESIADVYERTVGAVVRIDARPPGTPLPMGPPREDDGVATGSGFVVDRSGDIVTNDHVVEGGSVISVQEGEHGKRVSAKVIGTDPGTDLALIRVAPSAVASLTPLELGNLDDVRIGDPALAIGGPFGLQRTLTVGVVSAKDREVEAPNGKTIKGVVQTDAPINPGNSGGPLLDGRGRVIGVNSQTRGDGLGFAVGVDTIRKVLPALKAGKKGVQRAFLGVSTAPADGATGAVVRDVTRGSAAASAGIKDGDAITAVDGRAIRNPGDLLAAVGRHDAGDSVTLTVERDGKKVTLHAKLGTRSPG
jgi:putative serine protease PepD